MGRLNRRKVLGAGLGMAAGATADIGPAGATEPQLPAVPQSRRVLKMATTWPADYPGLAASAQRLADRVTTASGGELVVHVHAAGDLVPVLDAFEAVADGDIDLYHAADATWAFIAPAYQLFGAIPFGLTGAEHVAWLRHGGGQSLWDRLGEAHGVKPLLCGRMGAHMGGWFKRPVEMREAVAGLRIRVPGLGGEVWRAAGAFAVTMPVEDAKSAMQAGSLDAAEWAGPWHDLTEGLHEAASHYAYPGCHEPGPTIALGVNRSLWGVLSHRDRAVLEACALAEVQAMAAEFDINNARALNRLTGEHGVTLSGFAPEVLEALGGAARAVYGAIAESDPLERDILRSIVTFRDEIDGWTGVADEAVTRARRFALAF